MGVLAARARGLRARRRDLTAARPACSPSGTLTVPLPVPAASCGLVAWIGAASRKGRRFRTIYE